MRRPLLRWILVGLLLAALLPVAAVPTLRREYLNEIAIKRARLVRPRLVMLGDSLTLMGSPWGPRIGYDPFSAVTIATGGNVLGQVARGAEWAGRLHPRYVHVLAGTNDLLLGARDARGFARTYAALVDDLRARRLRVIVTLIPPTADRRENARVAAFNAELRRVLGGRGVPLIDLWPRLGAGGVLHPAYTIDGIHLNERGYRLWEEEIARASRA